MKTNKVLFTNDCNGHEGHDPYANLLEISVNYTEDILRKLEHKQLGVCRRGGSWKEIMKDGNINYDLISSGRLSEFEESDYDFKYELISGNY